MAAKGNGNSKNKAKKPVSQPSSNAKKKAKKKNSGNNNTGKAPAGSRNSKPKKNSEDTKPRDIKIEKHEVKEPSGDIGTESGEKESQTIEEKLKSLKRKMHREIFERCVEKHLYSNISEWEDMPLDEEGIAEESDELD